MADPNPYAAASAGALDDIRAATATPEPAAPPTPVAAPAVTEPTAPVATVSAPTPAVEPQEEPAPTPTPQPEEEEEITWNGRTIRLPKEEARVLIQKGYDYTQKTQTLAEIRRQVESERQQFEAEKAEVVSFLRDPTKVKQYYDALVQQAGLQPTAPDEIPTMAQVQQAMKAQADLLERQTQERIAKTVQQAAIEIEAKRAEGDYKAEIERSVAAAIQQHPVLNDFYEPGDIGAQLKKDAWSQIEAKIAVNDSYIPSNADLRTLILAAAKRRADKANLKLQDHAKMAAARAAKLQTTGIEPPGGAPPTPPPPQKLKLGSPELRAAVLADLEAAYRKA